MKLTYCSFSDTNDVCTVCVIDGWFDKQVTALEACWEAGLFKGDAYQDGQFISWWVPEDEPLIQRYIDNRNRHITSDEARELFEAKSIGEWKKHAQN